MSSYVIWEVAICPLRFHRFIFSRAWGSEIGCGLTKIAQIIWPLFTFRWWLSKASHLPFADCPGIHFQPLRVIHHALYSCILARRFWSRIQQNKKKPYASQTTLLHIIFASQCKLNRCHPLIRPFSRIIWSDGRVRFIALLVPRRPYDTQRDGLLTTPIQLWPSAKACSITLFFRQWG